MVGVHGVVVKHRPGHVAFFRLARLPQASRAFGPVVAVGRFVPRGGVGVAVHPVPLGLVVVDLTKGVVAPRTVGASVTGPQDVDVAAHGLFTPKEALRHDVLRVDRIGVGHKSSALLEAGVDAFDVAVAEDVGVAVHLPPPLVVPEAAVLTVVPVALEPRPQIFEVEAAWGIGLSPCSQGQTKAQHRHQHGAQQKDGS